MEGVERTVRTLAPATAVALVVFAWANAHAGDGEVVRHREFDGVGSPVSLEAVERAHRTARTDLERAVGNMVAPRAEPQDRGSHAGLPSCFSARMRTVTRKEPLPEPLRGKTVYFVTASGAGIPKLLAKAVGKDALVLVVDATSLSDVATLANAVDVPVSLASAELAGALGVDCRDAAVSVSAGGRTLSIQEGRP